MFRMATCASCRKEIRPTGISGIRDGRKAYHLACAPKSLLSNAVEEWDAILSRGIEYYVGKYSVKSSPRGKDALFRHFASLGVKLKAEAQARGQ